MSSFSIDDVRHTLTADLSRLLADVEKTTGEAIGVLAPLSRDLTRHGAPFRVVRDAGHSIYGTSSLVSAESLMSSARVLEALAEHGQRELELALRHAARARQIAELAAAGSAEMHSMLELELNHQPDDAHWVALEWQGRANELLSTTTADGNGAGRHASVRHASGADEEWSAPAVGADATAEATPKEFEFGDDHAPDAGPLDEQAALAEATPADPPPEGVVPAAAFEFEAVAPASAKAIQDELKAIFQDEAREALVGIHGHLEALFAEPSGLGGARALERLYHTLKGASATVGLDGVSAIAHALQERIQEVVDGGRQVDDTLLEALLTGTAELAHAAGLPNTTITLRRGPYDAAEAPTSYAPAHAPLSAGERQVESQTSNRDEPSGSVDIRRETYATFHGEAREICGEAWALVRSLEGQSSGTGSAMLDTVTRLGRLFHRLKGSAVLVGEEAVAREASALQRACQGETSRDASPAALKEGLERIGLALGFDEATRPPTRLEAPERHAVAEADPELWQAFSLESTELLEAIDAELLSLEESDRPRDRLRALLPVYHTLKGVVNTLGLVPTGKALHRVEDFVEGLLGATVLPSMRAVVSCLLQVQVEVRRNLKEAKRGYVEFSLGRLEARLARVLAGHRVADLAGGGPATGDGVRSGHLDSEGASGGVSSRADMDALARSFVRVRTEQLDNLMNLAGELVVSRSRLVTRVQALRGLHAELARGGRRLTETVERFVEEYNFARLDGRKRAAGVPALTSAPADFDAIEIDVFDLEDLKVPPPRRPAALPAREAVWADFSELELDRYEDVHVLSRSLAELTGDFGEIFGQMTKGLGALTDDSDAFGGIVNGIQSEVSRARMVPLEVLFNRLRLPVRDASVREAKDVRVVTRGESVRLDKAIADALIQPMLHLVRNAVAHGLESAAERDAAGKPRIGTIELIAREELGQVVVEVKDDGAGLDLERLRARGVAMGLLPADADVDDPGVKELVFSQGLSTAASARAVAGRGVGCAAVRRAIEGLNGAVAVESERGAGTCFVLTLPVTLTITRALLVRRGSQSFAIPLYFAERILDAADQGIVESAGVRRVKIDEGFVPISDLSALIGRGGSRSTGPVVVLRTGAERVVLQVDAVVGQEEIVIKSLGAVLTGHPLFAGVTVRGTGELVLVLDVAGLAAARGTTVANPARARPALRSAAVDPPAEAVERVAAAPAPPPPSTGGVGPRRTRVLFVDDSLSVRKVAEHALASIGVEVTLAVDGLDAMAKLREGTFDLVFTDLEMPRMHGFELIRELRFLAAYHDLPIVVVTSRSGQKHQDQARSLGATDYLTKPFTTRALEAAIDAWGRRRRGVAP